MNKMIKGSALTAEDQRHVLAAYTHRFTREHKPRWAQSNPNYTPQFASDRDWLENTLFYVRDDGRLDKRFTHCQSTPTWPDGKGAWGSVSVTAGDGELLNALSND